MRITLSLLAAALVGALAFTTTASQAQTPPKLKMTTDIPPEITTPDSVETRLGTLKFFDGFPDDATVEKKNIFVPFGNDRRSRPVVVSKAAGITIERENVIDTVFATSKPQNTCLHLKGD